jgi:SAM-dependent methyltransferase
LLERFVRPRDRILEIGAAKSWAAQHLLPLGCEYVAADLIVDPVIGLGRGRFFEQRVGPYLRVQADGERLPFADGAFDVAFCVATLHHALDLGAMVGELARVTRRGGVVAALNEGTRAPYASGANPEQAHEQALGINEHVHTMWSYLWAFGRAGLRPLRLEYAEGSAELEQRNIAGKLLRLGRIPATLWALNAYPYAGLSLYARRR